MKTVEQLYEELRVAVDNGHESMTHEDALTCVRSMHEATATTPCAVQTGEPAGAAVRAACGQIIKILAEIVGAPQTDAQLDAGTVPRDPLMRRVQQIRTQVDVIYKELPARPHTAQPAPAAVAGPSDTLRGDTQSLVQNITALLELDAEGALVPHGIGGHARVLLSAAASRLAAVPTTQPAPQLPERDASVPAEQQGLFRKFDVRRVDGSDKPGGKHHGCTYFVLDVDHDPCARPALAAYAAACEATHPALAADLLTKWGAAPTTQPAQEHSDE